ncbi:MAG: galactose-1-phosphate uridylyltransferase [Acidimicrobiia bacterium]
MTEAGDPSSTPAHQLRHDPLTDEWVAIVGDRQSRPNQPVSGCPFCVGGLEAPEPYSARAFPNRWPPFVAGAPIDLPDATAGPVPIGATRPPRGAAEVVLYTSDHVGSLATIGVVGARAVVDLWAARTAALLARDDVGYVLVFENRGAAVGATISHPHGQIYGFPTVPPLPAREVEAARARGTCPVCAVVGTELEAGDRVVAVVDGWTVHVPFAAGHPFETLVAPQAHVTDLAALDDRGRDGLAAALVDVVGRYDRLFAEPLPYLMWVHPGVHLHLHFAPVHRAPDTLRYVASAEVGARMLFNPLAPEDAARQLRGA